MILSLSCFEIVDGDLASRENSTFNQVSFIMVLLRDG